MKVSVLSYSSRNAGGLFYSVRWLSQSLVRNGVDIKVLSPRDEHSHDDLKVWCPISVQFYTARGPLGIAPDLPGILHDSAADMVHLHGIWRYSQRAALQWQKRSNGAVIISPRGMLDSWAVQNSAWKKKLIGALFANESLRRATCIHALCRSEVESIRAYGLRNPVALIPNAVELPSLTSDPCPPTSGVKRKLLFLGRIHPKKGLSELLKGWAKAKSQKSKAFSNWQLLIAGWDDGNHLAGLKQLASQLDLAWSDEALSSDLRPLSSDLCFIGSKYGKEKEKLFRSVDAFVLPSFSEGLPMSVLEAWSYGLPVVITDFCNLPEGFQAEAAIHVVPRAESIAQGLSQLIAMTNIDLAAMGARGRALVETSFTWPKIASDMQGVYEWCLDQAAEPPECMIMD